MRQISCIIFLIFLFLASCARQPVYPEPERIGSDVVINISSLKPAVPEFFTYHYNKSININFFVINIDGKILSFFDACERCYPKKLGYRFDNGSVVCRACDIRFPLSEVEKGIGNCAPIKLGGDVKEGKYFIPVSSIEGKADKF
ncbi:MAG: DUF2318 domain-containing protein [Nitrospirae bacterium]|nr:DUF2318 domain-containing protein [Nitrospirota bacterium]